MKLYEIFWNDEGYSGSTFVLGTSINDAKANFYYWHACAKVLDIQQIFNPSNSCIKTALNYGRV